MRPPAATSPVIAGDQAAMQGMMFNTPSLEEAMGMVDRIAAEYADLRPAA